MHYIYKDISMNNKRLVSNINIRLNLEDIRVLKEEASKLRIPVSTYYRNKLTEHIEQKMPASVVRNNRQSWE